MSIRDGSSPEAHLCDQVSVTERLSYGCSELRRRYRENPREMRGVCKPTVSPVAMGAFTARKIVLMAVMPAGNPAVPAGRGGSNSELVPVPGSSGGSLLGSSPGGERL